MTLLCQITVQCALILGVGVAAGGVTAPHWATVAWVVALGTLAVVPLGAAIGCLMPSPKSAGAILGLPMMALMVVSGVMIPVTVMPEVVQWIAQAFPLYWQGLGLRSAFLPDSMLAAEIAGSWASRVHGGRARRLGRSPGPGPSACRSAAPPAANPAHGWPNGGSRHRPRRSWETCDVSAEDVYNRITVLRAERGISRRDLAGALGVHYQTIGYLERGDTLSM